jgi:hypothetical protein
LTSIAAELAQSPSDGAAVAESLRVEYQVTMTSLADIRSGRAPAGAGAGRYVPIKLLPVYNHAKTKRLFANATRALIESAELPYANAKPPDFEHKPTPAKLILGGNLAGEYCYWMLMPANRGTVKKRCQERVELETTRILLAMRAYQMKHQRLPENLEALTPEFLPSIPEDAFNGEPLRYSTDKKVVYSVGENLRDDDGQIAKVNYRQLDYGCAVEF